MTFKKLTPVLLSRDVDTCVEFWTNFGFQESISVPLNDQKTGFAAVHKDGIELMYQDYAFGERRLQEEYRSVLYFEVSSFDEIREAAQQHEIVVPEHVTDYGAREVYIRDPAGNMIGFAEQGVEN